MKGKVFIPYTELEKHQDDTSNALADIGRWIMSVEESCDQKFKEKLLLLLTPTLQSLNDNKKDSIEVEEELPSSLLVKTSLKMAEIDFSKFQKNY